MTLQPFLVVPWHTAFIPALIDLALERTDGDISKACFIFPHARPARYMTDCIRDNARIAKPCVMPRMEPVSTLFALARSGSIPQTAQNAGLLDQVALLLRCVREAGKTRTGLLRDLPLDDSRRFFPWGVRLAGLMEELFQHNRTPEDYIHVRDEVTPFAAALLENLGTLHELYRMRLLQEGWTTPGYDACMAARNVMDGRIPSMPGVDGKVIFLAGFHTLTGSQDTLFKYLWSERDAVVCLHADPNCINGSPHWSCEHFVRWAAAWHTRCAPFRHTDEKEPPRPAIRFKAGFDVHSQLDELARDMRETRPVPGSSGTAIVLPDTSLLMPVLHHLPDTDINISMGYPLARSPLFRLIESILRLQETRRGSGPYRYHWKSLIALIRHPYVKMLLPDRGKNQSLSGDGSRNGSEDSRLFRRYLGHAEQTIRNGRRFALPADIPDAAGESAFGTGEGAPARSLDSSENDRTAHTALFRAILDAAIFTWEDAANPADIASALDSLVTLLRRYGNHLWRHYPIDAECLYRLSESVIPALAHTALADESLPRESLYSILRQLLTGERVPFEAYPLVGVQVVGMLETRLLQFDRLAVVDLTDDRLPGGTPHDPLIPDALRPMLGLPDRRGRERLMAYTFFRLVAGAKEVTLYWQEGIATSGLADGKKIRSRFVEELLWNEEQRLGRVLSPEKPEHMGTDGPLERISCVLPSVPRERRILPVTPAAARRMEALLARPLSPSLINTYVQCPASFFYERLGRLATPESAIEGRDPVGTGIFVHKVLQRYFSSRLGTAITATERDCDAMATLFREELEKSERLASLPADERIMLEESGPRVFAAMLETQAGRTPIALEKELSAPLVVDGKTRTLYGVLDRIDTDNGERFILDYKTGHIAPIRASVWRDDALWQEIAAWRPGDGNDTLRRVADAFPSIQMPVYLYMYIYGEGLDARDALYVSMNAENMEIPLLGEKMSDAERSEIFHEKIPLLCTFILRTMKAATQFAPRETINCNWCSYRNMCIISPCERL